MSPSSHQSSGHSCEAEDERRKKRKLSNRESARRSRMRKQQQLQDLTSLAAQLERENRRMAEQVEELTRSHRRIEGENGELSEQAAELEERLRSLIAVLRYAEGIGGVTGEAPALPGNLFRPWQLPPRAFGVAASAYAFQN